MTERAGHARDIVREMDLDSTDALVLIKVVKKDSHYKLAVQCLNFLQNALFDALDIAKYLYNVDFTFER